MGCVASFWSIRRRAQFLTVLWLVASWSAAAQAIAPPSPARGNVYLFSGWVIPLIDSTHGTGAETIAELITARGVKAEVYDPADWQIASQKSITESDHRSPLAVIGYSLGANAAIEFCEKLRAATIPVQSLILIEANAPALVPANVAHAVHFYVSGTPAQIRPGPGFTGSLRTVDLTGTYRDAARLNHWSVSHFAQLHKAVLSEILAGDRLRIWTKNGRSPLGPTGVHVTGHPGNGKAAQLNSY